MGKPPSFELGLKKGPWTSEEDQKLISYIEEHGHKSWCTLPLKAGLQRCGKSCRLRWRNYLRPGIKRGKFSSQEEQTIIQLHALLGNRWSVIATHIPRRTDHEIKNYWNTHLKKRLTKMGIDPVTHKLRIASATNLSHITQWENARLEAEARFCRNSPLILEPYKQHGSTAHVNESLDQCFLQPKLQCLDVLQAWENITLSKQSSYLKGLQTPISTLNSFETAQSSLFNIKNHSMPVTNPIEITESSSIMNMSTNDCMNGFEILKEPVNILDGSKRDNTLEVIINIVDKDDYTMEALACPLTDNGTNDYWSHILEEVGHNSSCSSLF